MSTRTWATFAEQLTVDLASIEKRFGGVLSRSSIINVDPNRGSSGGFAFIGFAEWDWSPDDELIPRRDALRPRTYVGPAFARHRRHQVMPTL